MSDLEKMQARLRAAMDKALRVEADRILQDSRASLTEMSARLRYYEARDPFFPREQVEL
jgi:hypothetical protein